METITHNTARGSSEFGLSNTNKLLKMETDFTVTGLKTGSTSLAGCCLSATGRKDGIDLIAVVLDAPDYKARFTEARTLLNYGYSLCQRYEDTEPPQLSEIPVTGGKQNSITLEYAEKFSAIRLDGEEFTDIEKKLELPETIKAPVEKGTEIGELIYYQKGIELGKTSVIAAETVEKATYPDYLKQLWKQFLVHS
jgi:D-alanyl-D-alanine carboxypeptidase (penicillin-binding protein 5/6)